MNDTTLWHMERKKKHREKKKTMPKADTTLPLHWLLNLTSVTKRVGGTPLCCPNLLEAGLSGHGVIQRAKQ